MRDDPRVSRAWVTVAAVILTLHGINTIFYSGFLPALGGIDATVSLPLLGSASVLWLGLGALDLVAAAGIYARRTWGRYLGVVSVVVSIVVVALTAGSPGSLAAVSLVFPIFVLFALWRRWP